MDNPFGKPVIPTVEMPKLEDVKGIVDEAIKIEEKQAKPETPKQRILREHGFNRSDIPVNSNYFKLRK